MKIISVTGGKGGTGKTLFATNLAYQFSKIGKKVLLIDSDVENPNTYIMLGKPHLSDIEKKEVKIFLPKFDLDKCTSCGICSKACYRHAILQFLDQPPSVMEHMCSGCITCYKVCPEKAIIPSTKLIGFKYFIENIHPNLDLLVGELLPSEAISVKVIENLLQQKNRLLKERSYDVIIIDTAPGAHCDVELALSEADKIIAITEPTPFGLHDLKRIIDLVHLIGKEAEVVLNRADLSDFKDVFVEEIRKLDLKMIGEIPVDQDIIECYARGKPFVSSEKDFPGKKSFLRIFEKINNDLEGGN